MHHWPELREKVNDLLRLVFPGRAIEGDLKQLIFTAASLASGCLHCQSHGSYHLHKLGVADERIQALWSYRTSPEFSDAERAALDLAFAAGVSPNVVEPGHYVELRKHYSNDQIIEILAVIAVGGFLNRWNDTIATVTDQESIDFAERVLRPVGWNSGKAHRGPGRTTKGAPHHARLYRQVEPDAGYRPPGWCLNVFADDR